LNFLRSVSISVTIVEFDLIFEFFVIELMNFLDLIEI